MNLEELRKKIDAIDSEVVKLIADRIRTAREIGEVKHRQGRHVNDQSREARVLEHIRDIAREENVGEEVIATIYQKIITECRRTQETEVAFQGEAGAYGEEAAFQFFGPHTTARPCESLDEVFKLVAQDEMQYGIIPVENSLEGSIGPVSYTHLTLPTN